MSESMLQLAEQAARTWFTVSQVSVLGAGHIHDTFLLSLADGQRFVLQRVNQTVFGDPELVMRQTQRLLAVWARQSTYRVPELQPTPAGEAYQTIDSDVWRLWRYIEPSQVLDPPQSPQQAKAVAGAFGCLQNLLTDMPGAPFDDPIPGFLQLPHYLKAYDQVASAAPTELQALVKRHRGLADKFTERHCHIHGDCKVNNVLFDLQAEHVVAVIDFDTAMFGHWAWDFGDLVRSVCFSLGRVDLDYVAACAEGFAPFQPRFNAADAADAPAYVALMLGIRFLTDHLSGNHYFRVEREGQNLLRAHQQFELLQAFTGQRSRMCRLADAV